MAVQNYVMLNGQVVEVLASVDDATGDIKCITITMKVIRRKDAVQAMQSANLKTDFPIVFVRDKEQIEKLKNMETGDMIEVIGVICTVPSRKRYTCKECGESNTYMGTRTYIHPTYICLKECMEAIGHQVGPSEGWEMVKERGEISNYINITGRICRDVRYYNKGNSRVCAYQVAVNRKLHIMEDAPEIRTDYIWVKSLGAQAEKDAEALHKDSRVIVIGSIQSKNRMQGLYEITHVCEHCGAENEIMGDTMEIVPYYVEYLENYTFLQSKRYAGEDELEEYLTGDAEGGENKEQYWGSMLGGEE